MRQNFAVLISSALMFLVFAQYLIRHFGLKTAALLSYFFANALFYMTLSSSILVRKNAAEWVLIHLALLVFFSLLTNVRSFKFWRATLLSIVMSSIAYYLIHGGNCGLIDAYTFEAAMLMFAVLLPVYSKQGLFSVTAGLMLVITALLIGGSTCIGILTAFVLGHIFYSKYTNLKIATVGLGIIGLLFAHRYTDLLNDSGRFEMWSQYLEFWHYKFNMVWGSGIGTFKNISPHVGPIVSKYLYAHNDILELYLETGLIGLSIFAYLCTTLLFYAHKVKLGHTVIMILIFMGNYFPNQVMLTKFLFVMLIATIYHKNQALKLKII